MQVEEVTSGNPLAGTPHFFTAILLKDWEFWIPGPSHHLKVEVLAALSAYPTATHVQLIKHYVPFVQ